MIGNASALFRATFAVAPRVVASAPGRVNLLGEHTDYNGGPVLPVATALRTPVAGRPRAPRRPRLLSPRGRGRGRACMPGPRTPPGRARSREPAPLRARHIPIRGRLLLVDPGTRHQLTAGALNERRAECEGAVGRLKLELPELVSLASWPARWLPRLKRALAEPLRSRALHVVGETARTRFGAQLLTRGHMRRFGELLYEAHESCRRLYECSAPELDVVVAAARRAGALGARLTGAGWGGAVLVLLGKGDGGRGKGEAKVAKEIRRAFAAEYGREPTITHVRPSGGARGKIVTERRAGGPVC